MKKLRHRNIVSLHAVIDDATSDKMYLVMDYVPNGTLVRPAEGAAREAGLLYEPLEEEQCRDVFRQLVDGLRYLHRNGICHRDIKPENILCGSGGRVYLSDFGVSEIMSVQGSVSTKSSGTPTFWPPEMFSFETETLVSGAQVDIWALGVTLYMMLCGRSPFRGTSFLELSKSITCDEVTFPPSLSDDARGLLSSMLAKDPSRRPSLKGILQHPFIVRTPLAPWVGLKHDGCVGQAPMLAQWSAVSGNGCDSLQSTPSGSMEFHAQAPRPMEGERNAGSQTVPFQIPPAAQGVGLSASPPKKEACDALTRGLCGGNLRVGIYSEPNVAPQTTTTQS